MNIKVTPANVELSFSDLVTVLADNYDSYWAEFERLESEKLSPEEMQALYPDENISADCVCWEERLAHDLMSGKQIRVYDREEEKYHSLSKKSFQKAYVKLIKEYPKRYANMVNEDYDSTEVDMILQLATFGEVIYG